MDRIEMFQPLSAKIRIMLQLNHLHFTAISSELFQLFDLLESIYILFLDHKKLAQCESLKNKNSVNNVEEGLHQHHRFGRHFVKREMGI